MPKLPFHYRESRLISHFKPSIGNFQIRIYQSVKDLDKIIPFFQKIH